MNVEWVDLFAEVRSDVDRFAERVAGLHTEIATRVSQIQLQRVVTGITCRFLPGHRSVVGPEWPPCAIDHLTLLRHEHAVFGERSARRTARGNLVGLAHTETERRIARVRLTNDQD